MAEVQIVQDAGEELLVRKVLLRKVLVTKVLFGKW